MDLLRLLNEFNKKNDPVSALEGRVKSRNFLVRMANTVLI